MIYKDYEMENPMKFFSKFKKTPPAAPISAMNVLCEMVISRMEKVGFVGLCDTAPPEWGHATIRWTDSDKRNNLSAMIEITGYASPHEKFEIKSIKCKNQHLIFKWKEMIHYSDKISLIADAERKIKREKSRQEEIEKNFKREEAALKMIESFIE